METFGIELKVVIFILILQSRILVSEDDDDDDDQALGCYCWYGWCLNDAERAEDAYNADTKVNKPEAAASLLDKAGKLLEKERPEDATGLYEKVVDDGDDVDDDDDDDDDVNDDDVDDDDGDDDDGDDDDDAILVNS